MGRKRGGQTQGKGITGRKEEGDPKVNLEVPGFSELAGLIASADGCIEFGFSSQAEKVVAPAVVLRILPLAGSPRVARRVGKIHAKPR